MLAVLGVGGVFIFHTLSLSQKDIIILTAILLFSLIIMFTVEYRQFTKDIQPIKAIFSQSQLSYSTIQEGFETANKFPIFAMKRIFGPHLLGLSIPAILLTNILIYTGDLTIPAYYILLAVIGAILVAGMHALIEFFLTTTAVQSVMKEIVKLAEEKYNKKLSLEGRIVISLKRKFQISSIFIGIFPLLLFGLASQIRFQEISNGTLGEYWEWAIVVMVINIVFAIVASYLLYKGIEQPIEQLKDDMRSVQSGSLKKTDEIYSDEFSRLTLGFNQMVDGIKERDQLNINLSESLITTLAAALDAKDSYTAGHTERVAMFSVEIAKRANLDELQISNLRKSALLHDIGKIGIPDKILLKDGKLTDEEFAEIKKHPIYGYEILKQVTPISSIKPYLNGVRHHHERYDGKGYPDQLKGNDIPLFGRIMAVADAFDAMTSDRPYRKGFTQEKAIAILKDGKGTQWDEEFVELFLDYLKV